MPQITPRQRVQGQQVFSSGGMHIAQALTQSVAPALSQINKNNVEIEEFKVKEEQRRQGNAAVDGVLDKVLAREEAEHHIMTSGEYTPEEYVGAINDWDEEYNTKHFEGTTPHYREIFSRSDDGKRVDSLRSMGTAMRNDRAEMEMDSFSLSMSKARTHEDVDNIVERYTENNFISPAKLEFLIIEKRKDINKDIINKTKTSEEIKAMIEKGDDPLLKNMDSHETDALLRDALSNEYRDSRMELIEKNRVRQERTDVVMAYDNRTDALGYIYENTEEESTLRKELMDILGTVYETPDRKLLTDEQEIHLKDIKAYDNRDDALEFIEQISEEGTTLRKELKDMWNSVYETPDRKLLTDEQEIHFKDIKAYNDRDDALEFIKQISEEGSTLRKELKDMWHSVYETRGGKSLTEEQQRHFDKIKGMDDRDASLKYIVDSSKEGSNLRRVLKDMWRGLYESRPEGVYLNKNNIVSSVDELVKNIDANIDSTIKNVNSTKKYKESNKLLYQAFERLSDAAGQVNKMYRDDEIDKETYDKLLQEIRFAQNRGMNINVGNNPTLANDAYRYLGEINTSSSSIEASLQQISEFRGIFFDLIEDWRGEPVRGEDVNAFTPSNNNKKSNQARAAVIRELAKQAWHYVAESSHIPEGPLRDGFVVNNMDINTQKPVGENAESSLQNAVDKLSKTQQEITTLHWLKIAEASGFTGEAAEDAADRAMEQVNSRREEIRDEYNAGIVEYDPKPDMDIPIEQLPKSLEGLWEDIDKWSDKNIGISNMEIDITSPNVPSDMESAEDMVSFLTPAIENVKSFFAGVETPKEFGERVREIGKQSKVVALEHGVEVAQLGMSILDKIIAVELDIFPSNDGPTEEEIAELLAIKQ